MSTAIVKTRLALDVVLRWPSQAAKQWATSALGSIALRPETAAIVAIGSGVRPSHHRNSDVDFLIITDLDNQTFVERPIDVDLRLFRSCDVERQLSEGNDLLGWAARFGRSVFDPRYYWENLKARWADRLPLPSPDPSMAMALRFEGFARELFSIGDLDAALEQVIAMLTHKSRATLLRAGVYPASRPELPGQLQNIGENQLADWLHRALIRRQIAPAVLRELNLPSNDPAQPAR